MRSVRVVVADVRAHDTFELATGCTMRIQSKHSRRRDPIGRAQLAFALGARIGVLITRRRPERNT